MAGLGHYTLFNKQENSRTGLPCSASSIEELIIVGLVLTALHTSLEFAISCKINFSPSLYCGMLEFHMAAVLMLLVKNAVAV
jgi:hypothetical protein